MYNLTRMSPGKVEEILTEIAALYPLAHDQTGRIEIIDDFGAMVFTGKGEDFGLRIANLARYRGNIATIEINHDRAILKTANI